MDDLLMIYEFEGRQLLGLCDLYGLYIMSPSESWAI